MNSFILVGEESKRTSYITDFAHKQNIAVFDVRIFEPEENSFGIKEVREAQKTAFIKPMQSKEKVLVFNNAHLLTIEAQNALLKLLEEPPSNSYIFLAAATDAPFLPTIISRCKIILLVREKKEMTDEKRSELEEQISKLSEESISQKLALAENISSDKEKLSEWFDEVIILLREKMIGEPTNRNYLVLLKNIQEARTLFQTTNVSPRMILEHALLLL